MNMPVTRMIAERVSEISLADIPHESVDYAKTLMLSAIGAIVQGPDCTGGDIIERYVERTGGAEEAMLFATGRRLPMEAAALANATFAHATEYEDDSFPEAVSSYTIVPAVLAVAEQCGASGADMIAAFVAGYETQARIGLACREARRRGYMVLSLAGSIGCAAAAARLMGLDAERTAHALSIAASQANGLGYQTGTMAHIVEMGFSARNGICAALLAKDGYTGQLDILEAPRGLFNLICADNVDAPEKIIEDWGRPYRIHEVGIKEFPCCYHLQRMIETALELRESEGLRPDQIEEIEVHVNAFFPTVVQHDDPSNEIEAQFSLPHAFAVGLLEDVIDQSSFAVERIGDPRFSHVRSLVRTVVRDDWGWSPTGWTPRIAFTLKDGRQILREPEHSRGQPPNLFSFDECEPKFRKCVTARLGEDAIQTVLKDLSVLEQLDDVSRLVAALASGARR
ncbi:MmgE/PrpD family protein [Arvimicrobium flavum]|uniref:MmgE/PrpD family protein n=1 Tax=Arvimicrobium flavum TaxID=3393320 RepID=UPI00237A7814|nr:MmgE/PrpD family protein [Mesorhizobium shangrilense]